ncbi:MAG TPA: TniQ family protein [Chloroflexota bacterium]|nr:TniQ family protein [Chloroflexota bacterium]
MIGVDAPRWLTTLPHLVTPLADEWLVGLLLRCDLANGWSAGTTGRRLRRSPTSLNILDKALGAFATARTLDLAGLAALLAVPLSSLHQTTFAAGLTRLRAPGQPTPRRMAVARPFRVCPACIAAQRLIARSHVLPLVASCQEHGAWLESRCRCGARLRPFHRAAPFTCPACALGWWELPSRRADDDTRALDTRLLRLFHHFLECGTADSISHAMQVVVAELAKRDLKRLPPIPREAALPSVVWDQATVSLARVVGALAALGLPPEAVGPPPQPRVPASQVPCLNRVCPRFERRGAGNVHPFRRTPQAEIYYCSECGSHFSRTRLVSSFDEGCSPRGASPRRGEVVEGRARLVAWRVALEAACAQMLAEDVPLAVTAAFRRAGLPRTPRLRARRLGLVDLVERYAAWQGGGMRERILAGGRDGLTPVRLERTLGVSSTLVRQVLACRPKRRAGRPRRIRVEQNGALWAQVEANPTATAAMHTQTWREAQGTDVRPSTMRDAIYRLGWRRGKGRWTPPRDAPNAERLACEMGPRRAD